MLGILVPRLARCLTHTTLGEHRFCSDRPRTHSIWGTSVLELGRITLTRRTRFFGSARFLDGTNIAVKVALRTLTDKMPPTVYWGETINDAGGARFSLSIPDVWPGPDGGLRTVLFSLVAYPIDASRMPPWRINSFQPPNPGGRIDLELPAEDTLLNVSGQVRIRENLPISVVGARVFLVDENGRQVSSEARTSPSGAFTLKLWPTSAGQSYTSCVEHPRIWPFAGDHSAGHARGNR